MFTIIFRVHKENHANKGEFKTLTSVWSVVEFVRPGQFLSRESLLATGTPTVDLLQSKRAGLDSFYRRLAWEGQIRIYTLLADPRKISARSLPNRQWILASASMSALPKSKYISTDFSKY